MEVETSSYGQVCDHEKLKTTRMLDIGLYPTTCTERVCGSSYSCQQLLKIITKHESIWICGGLWKIL